MPKLHRPPTTPRRTELIEAAPGWAELAERLRDGPLTSNVGAMRPLAEARAAFDPDAPRVSEETIIRVTEG